MKIIFNFDDDLPLNKMLEIHNTAIVVKDIFIKKINIIHKFFLDECLYKLKMQSVKQKSLYILLSFLLITIALLIAVSIYCYLIKYKAKQKHLLPFYVKNNKLKEVLYY